MSGQTKVGSAVETAANIAIGYTINQTAQILLFPLVGIHVPLSANFALGMAFTVISVVRSYCLRRAFNSFKLWRAQ